MLNGFGRKNMKKHSIKQTKNKTKCRILKETKAQELSATIAIKAWGQQIQKDGDWRPVSFASRFLTDFESKVSIIELELLAIVWAIEHFENYVYGKQVRSVVVTPNQN